MNLAQTSAAFETTNWNLLDALCEGDQIASSKASQELMRRYWPPVYAWMRRSGLNRSNAEEATQAFFSDIVLQRNIFRKADRKRAPLRHLMLRALRNFRIDCIRRRSARIRTVPLTTPALNEEETYLAKNGVTDREESFEQRWALHLLQEALCRCEVYYKNRPTKRYWDAFEAFVVRPAATGNSPQPQAELAKALGFKDAARLAVAVQVVKARCRAYINEVVAEAALDVNEIEEEKALLHRLFG